MNFDRCRSFVSVSLDGLRIHSKTMQEHLLTWCQVFSFLRAERFYAKPSECQFFDPELEYVRFVVSATGISPQESNSRLSLSGLPPLPPHFPYHFGNLWFLPTL